MRQVHCHRCGGAEYSDEELARADHDEAYLPLPQRTIYMPAQRGTTAGRPPVCWECMSVEEQRYKEMQCARCAAQLDEDDPAGDGGAGWILPWDSDRGGPAFYLCPNCQTSEEAIADAERFVETMEQGRRLAESRGTEYPAHLEQLGERERVWAEWRKAANAELERQFGGGDDDGAPTTPG